MNDFYEFETCERLTGKIYCEPNMGPLPPCYEAEEEGTICKHCNIQNSKGVCERKLCERKLKDTI